MGSRVLAITAACWILATAPHHLCAQTDTTIIKNHRDERLRIVVTSGLQDSKGFVWLGTYSGLLKFDGYTFVKYQRNPGLANSIRHNLIHAISEDSHGRIWVSHEIGIDVFDPEWEKFTAITDNSKWRWKATNFFKCKDGSLFISTTNGVYLADIETLSVTRVSSIPNDTYWDVAQTTNGSIWAAGVDSIVHIDKQTSGIHYYAHDLRQTLGQAPALGGYPIHVDANDRIWVGGSGLNLFDDKNRLFRKFLAHLRVREISTLREGVLLVAYDFGLLAFDIRTAKYENIQEDDPSKSGASMLFTDRQGIIWLAGSFGLQQINPGPKRFRVEDKFHFTWATVEDGRHDVWIFSSAGIFRLDSSLTRVLDKRSSKNVQGMTVDRAGHVWLIHSGQIEIYDYRTQTIKIRDMLKSDPPRLISTIAFIDSFGDLWTGGWGGVARYDPKTKMLESMPVFPSASVFCFLEDDHKNLWIGSSVGLWRYNLLSKNFDIIEPNDADGLGQSNVMVFDLMLDKSRNLWVGTSAGLSRIDNYSGSNGIHFTRWDTHNSNIPTDYVLSIVEGPDRKIWLACDNIISEFDPSNNSFRNYDYATETSTEKIRHARFTLGKGIRTSIGDIILPTMGDGAVIFNPENLIDNTYIPPVYITRFDVRNQPYPIVETDAETMLGRSTLYKAISFMDTVLLSYNQNDFSLMFTALSFVAPERNRFRYRLEPYEQSWTETSAGSRVARYTNIDPGHYTFRVLASNSDGVWNEQGRSLLIIISPPWWQTRGAYILYAFLMTVMFILWRNYENRRIILKNRAEHLGELDRIKTRFFANISHEFRTPMTLILGPLKSLYDGTLKAEDHHRTFGTMIRNGKRLLSLIDQLLDLSRLEEGKMQIQASEMDIVGFIRDVSASYESWAKEKDIQFQYHSELPELKAYIDPEKVEKIFHNLLSNAFKFTPSGGKVSVYLRTDLSGIVVSVQDSGVGIPADQIGRIFDRFFQVEGTGNRAYEGSGLGMAICKELVDLHYGKITAVSAEGKGSVFTVWLPLGSAQFRRDQIVEARRVAQWPAASRLALSDFEDDSPSEDDEISIIRRDGRPAILVVEDNGDMRQYIRRIFAEMYDVIEAKDGREAFEIAKKLLPDLIISDVMMPHMDGYKFCALLKADRELNNIPVILLTAKNGQQSKLNGLDIGADDYLTKPFDAGELKLIVRNRMSERRKSRDRFSREVTLEPQHVSILSSDEKFLLKALSIVELRIGDENFSVHELCREVGFSHMQFYRKIKTLTGQTPSRFLRTIRLKRAAQLLAAQSDSVSQIAYHVGFSSLSYFNKCFKDHFGATPGEFASNNHKSNASLD